MTATYATDKESNTEVGIMPTSVVTVELFLSVCLKPRSPQWAAFLTLLSACMLTATHTVASSRNGNLSACLSLRLPFFYLYLLVYSNVSVLSELKCKLAYVFCVCVFMLV